MVSIKTYSGLPICKKDVLRYSGCKSDADFPNGILGECFLSAEEKLAYKVCYSVLNVNISGETCDFDVFRVNSSALAKNLEGSKKAVVFAATVGVEIDRLILKYTSLSPLKAIIFDAIGTSQAEALCDTFCEDIKKELKAGAKPRFSPGYGDFSLSYQNDIFAVLNCQKRIGLTLTKSLLMSPSKSVTAIMGLTDEQIGSTNKCRNCENINCVFRGDL